MGIFGKLDAETIHTNIYFVEAGEYVGEVTEAKFQLNRDGNQRQLVIDIKIDMEESKYNKKNVRQTFNLVDADMTAEAFALLPVEEQQKIHRENSNLKRFLCGNDGRPDHKGYGVAVDDLNDADWTPEVIKGTRVKFGIKNFGTDGVQVHWVNLLEE
jgi:hypothetical protein